MKSYKFVMLVSLGVIVMGSTGISYAKKPKKESQAPEKETTATNPNDPGGHSALGVEAAKKKDYETAIAEFSKAVEAEPKDSKNYFNRGTAYRRLNKLNEAAADFSQAIVDALKALKTDGTYDKVLSKWGVQSGGISDFAVNP